MFHWLRAVLSAPRSRRMLLLRRPSFDGLLGVREVAAESVEIDDLTQSGGAPVVQIRAIQLDVTQPGNLECAGRSGLLLRRGRPGQHDGVA